MCTQQGFEPGGAAAWKSGMVVRWDGEGQLTVIGAAEATAAA